MRAVPVIPVFVLLAAALATALLFSLYQSPLMQIYLANWSIC